MKMLKELQWDFYQLLVFKCFKFKKKETQAWTWSPTDVLLIVRTLALILCPLCRRCSLHNDF